jgi:YjbE family integral membrane protein
LVDLALSGDNALVIGAAAAGLSRRRRLLAILTGGGSAIVLRVIFAAAATLLLQLPLLEAIGGFVLLIIAARLLMGREEETHAKGTAEAEGAAAPKEPSFTQALLTILIADVTMSLDNILAVGGLAHGNLELLAIGLLISIALLMVGSAIVAELIGRLPVLLDLASLVLGWTAGSMIYHDHIVGPYLSGVPYGSYVIPAVGVALVLVVDIVLRVRAAGKRRAQPEALGEGQASETTRVR